MPMKDMNCWNIMNCNDESCVARSKPDVACWELVKQLKDYRAEFDICSDCIVFVLKTGSLNMTETEVAAMAVLVYCFSFLNPLYGVTGADLPMSVTVTIL